MLNAKSEEVAEDEVRGAVADAGGLHERGEAAASWGTAYDQPEISTLQAHSFIKFIKMHKPRENNTLVIERLTQQATYGNYNAQDAIPHHMLCYIDSSRRNPRALQW